MTYNFFARTIMTLSEFTPKYTWYTMYLTCLSPFSFLSYRYHNSKINKYEKHYTVGFNRRYAHVLTLELLRWERQTERERETVYETYLPVILKSLYVFEYVAARLLYANTTTMSLI